MNSLKLVTPSSRASVLRSASACGKGSRMIMCAPTSTQRLRQRSCQSSRPSSGLLPWRWLAKSITEVVPPKAAAMVPVPKVSTVRAVPNSQSRCVCTSTAPGMTRSPRHRAPRPLARRQVLAERAHLAVLDQNIALPVALRRDDPAVLDQRRHLSLPPRITRQSRPSARRGEGGRSPSRRNYGAARQAREPGNGEHERERVIGMPQLACSAKVTPPRPRAPARAR